MKILNTPTSKNALFFISIFGLCFLAFGCRAQQPCEYSIPFKNSGQFMAAMSYQEQTRNTLHNDMSAASAIIEQASNSPKPRVYELTHQLLVPMIYSFETKNMDMIARFDKLFSREIVNGVLDSKKSNELNDLVFLYLVTEYLRYREPTATGDIKTRNEELFNNIKNYIWKDWSVDKGSIWNTEHCRYVGRRSRIAYILTSSDSEPGKSYYKAITDFELFTMGIGASLAGYELEKQQVSSQMAEIVYYFMQVLRTQVTFTGQGGWLLQPGAWADHKDFMYAGTNNVLSSLTTARVRDVNWDASHFSRMPGYLNTLSALFSPQSTNGLYITKLKHGLANQFLTKVVSTSTTGRSNYQFKNFMNGENGVFRYKFSAALPKGYAPYGNATHVFFGWWKLLNDSQINKVYSDIYDNFPKYQDEDLHEVDNGNTRLLYKQIVGL